MINIINTTPHNIIDVESGIEFEKTDTVVRVSEKIEKSSEINNINIYSRKFGDVQGLPSKTKNTYYIVSLMVAQACPDRDDLLIPGQPVRDSDGKIIGCRGFFGNDRMG